MTRKETAYPLDEIEQLEAGRVDQVVPGHRLEDEVDDRPEQVVLNEVAVVKLVLHADAGAEVFQSGCRRSGQHRRGVAAVDPRDLLSLRCFSGHDMSWATRDARLLEMMKYLLR